MLLKSITVSTALALAVLSGLSFAGASLQGCVPSPRDVRCSNGGECKKADPKYAYCLNGRCVECVARGSCGAHKKCSHGECVPDAG